MKAKMFFILVIISGMVGCSKNDTGNPNESIYDTVRFSVINQYGNYPWSITIQNNLSNVSEIYMHATMTYPITIVDSTYCYFQYWEQTAPAPIIIWEGWMGKNETSFTSKLNLRSLVIGKELMGTVFTQYLPENTPMSIDGYLLLK